MNRVRHLLTKVAESDSTFALQTVRGRDAWVGLCVHCRKRIVVPLDPKQAASATLEHIVPRTHGGGDELDNLAPACATCNHDKGRRLDCRRRNDETLQRVIGRLREERLSRLRGPAVLPPRTPGPTRRA